MADHCDTCYCSEPKLYCGVKKKLFVKISLGLASISFIGMGFTMVAHLARNQFEGWSVMEIVTFLSCLASFTTTVLIILYVEMALFGEFLWSILCGVYEYFWDFLRYIRDGIVTWPCVLLSRMGALVGVHQQQEASASDSEANDEKPPLPPKNRNVTEAATSKPFQVVRPDGSQGSGSASAQSDDNDIESQFLGMTQGGRESATSSEKPGRRGKKKMTQKERFRKMMESLANMGSIEEEGSSSPEAAGINIPLSVLAENPGSSAPSKEATSFTKSSPTKREEKKTSRTAEIRETYKQISGLHSSSRATSIRDKQRSFKQSSVSNVRVFGSTTKQSFGSAESEQSLEQASTSRYVPASMLLCHPSPSQLNEGQKIQTAGEQASFAEHSSPKRQSKAFDTQRDRGQTSSYVGHSELEKQSREYGVVEAEREQSITEQPLSSIYVKFAIPKKVPKDQTTTSGFSGSPRPTQAPSIEKIHGSPDQTSMSYVSLPELENQSEEFDTRGTKRKQISPEHPSASRFVRILTSPDETEENTLTSSQRQARSSDFEKVQSNEVQASTSFEGLPALKTQPTESSSIGIGREQSSPVHRQPMPSYVKFSVPLSQAGEQSATAEFSASESQIQAHGVENKQESPDQSSVSYVTLQVLEQQSRKSVPRKAEKQEISPEQTPTSGYVPVSVAREQSATAEFSGSKSHVQARGVENKQGSPSQSPASYVALQVLEQQSEKSGTRGTEKQEISPEQPRYVPVSVLETQVQACSIDESKQIQAIRKHASETGMLTLQKESEREKKLKNLEQASVAGFYGVTTQTGDSKESPKLISSGYVPVQKVTEKSGSGAIPKRQERQRETLSSISVRPYPLWKTRGVEKKVSMIEGTSRSSMHGRMEPTPDIQKTQKIEDTTRAYVPHSALRFEPTVTQETERIIPRTRTERIQRSPKDSPTERKVKAQIKSFLSLNLASGGLVINKIKLEEDETILSSTIGPCESTFEYDQPTDVLDLSHIEVPLPRNEEESKKNEDGDEN